MLEPYLARKRSEMANSLIDSGRRSGKILDIGCGVYPYFLRNTDFKSKIGIDQAVEVSRVDDRNIKLDKINFEDKKLPYKNDFFQVVTMLAVFEHINKEKLQFVLKEVKRVLVPGGIFIITTPSPWSDKILHLLSRSGLISQEEIHDHKHNMSRENINKILSEVGFDNKKIKKGYFELGFNMWFVAEK